MMNNRNTRKMIFSAAALILIGSMVACSNTEVSTPPAAGTIQEEIDTTTADEPAEDFTLVDADGNTAIDNEALSTHLVQDPDAVLTDVEIQGLLYMREEEKLARDVYLTLGELWQQNIFQNISRSEQTHTDAVKVLLDQFGLEDPMAADEVGVFENEELQTLYDDLVATGSQSLIDALMVGAAIEEIDILDLEEYIEQTDNIDIQIVYENLNKGSRNHLRSFVSVLEKQSGETYVPQYMTVEAYETILDAAMETSGNRGNGGGNGKH